MAVILLICGTKFKKFLLFLFDSISPPLQRNESYRGQGTGRAQSGTQRALCSLSLRWRALPPPELILPPDAPPPATITFRVWVPTCPLGCDESPPLLTFNSGIPEESAAGHTASHSRGTRLPSSESGCFRGPVLNRLTVGLPGR